MSKSDRGCVQLSLVTEKPPVLVLGFFACSGSLTGLVRLALTTSSPFLYLLKEATPQAGKGLLSWHQTAWTGSN